MKHVSLPYSDIFNTIMTPCRVKVNMKPPYIPARCGQVRDGGWRAGWRVRFAVTEVCCGQGTTASSVTSGVLWCVPTCAATDSSVSVSVIQGASAPRVIYPVLTSRGAPTAATNASVTPGPRPAAIPRCGRRSATAPFTFPKLSEITETQHLHFQKFSEIIQNNIFI